MIATLQVSFLFTLALLVFFSTSLSSAADASRDNDDVGEEWKTAYTVGQFSYSDPPKPDQIFKIQYRVINGTTESVGAPVGGIVAKVDGRAYGLLEIKYPRNYPYANEDYNGKLDNDGPVVFVDGQDKMSGKNTTDCFFVFSIPFAGRSEIELLPTYLPIETPYRGDNVPDSCISDTVIRDAPARKDGTISPWHQFRAGVAARDVVCKEELELSISPTDKPYCAKPSNTEKLVELGWHRAE